MPSPQNAIALPRSSGGNSSSRTACESGCSPPPVVPWSTRKKISAPKLGARPHSTTGNREPAHHRQQQPLSSDDVGQPPADGQNHRVGDQVRGQHPGRFIDAGGQASGNVRQADIHHRGVQHLHDGARHHRDRNQPAVHRRTTRIRRAHGFSSRTISKSSTFQKCSATCPHIKPRSVQRTGNSHDMFARAGGYGG